MRVSIGLGSVLAASALALALDLRVAIRGNPAPSTSEALTRAREWVRAHAQPGDLLVHSPLFSLRELKGLGDLAAKPDLPLPELRANRRVVVIDRDRQPMGGLGRPALVEEIGDGVEIRIYAPVGSAQGLRFDLATAVDRAEMTVERPSGTVVARCDAKRAEGGLACPGQPEWLYLAPRVLTIEGKNATCVWAHPTNGGVIGIEIPGQAPAGPGHKLMLSLAGALTDDAAAGTPDGAPVRTEILQDGAIKGAIEVPNRIGWVRANVEIAPDRSVQLRVTTPRDGRRHHCLNAQIEER
jgi:hypothetical protein